MGLCNNYDDNLSASCVKYGPISVHEWEKI